MMFKKFIPMTLLAAMLCGGTLAAGAQSTTEGAIAGTVEDATNAVIPKAAVTIHNDGTNADLHLVADDSGYFKAPLLEPGSYTVTITAPSFGTATETHVIVEVGQLTTLQPKLTAGGEQTTVSVSADAATLNFESPEASALVPRAAIDNVPMANRRWSALALSTPGVVADASGFGLVSVRGAHC